MGQRSGLGESRCLDNFYSWDSETNIPMQVEPNVGVMRSAGIKSLVVEGWVSWIISGDKGWISMMGEQVSEHCNCEEVLVSYLEDQKSRTLGVIPSLSLPK